MGKNEQKTSNSGEPSDFYPKFRKETNSVGAQGRFLEKHLENLKAKARKDRAFGVKWVGLYLAAILLIILCLSALGVKVVGP